MELTDITVTMVNIVLAVLLSVAAVPVFVWWERRVAGFIQDRLGPNRSNIGGIRLGGLVQSVADMLKLFFKEEFMPSFIKYKAFYTLAPAIMFLCSFMAFGVIPFADNLVIDGKSYPMQALPMNLGLLWFLAFTGLSVYGIILGGYSSGSKFGILSSIRASSQVISYEAAMGLSLVSMLIVYGSVNIGDMVSYQGGLLFGFIPKWGIILQPLAAMIFIVTAFAETNRAPFDIAEGESEIVAGYHTEYSAMKFGMFQLSEYMALALSSAIIVSLFLGGYQIPWLNTETLHQNIDIVMIVIALLLLIVTFFFTRWIKQNNNWPDGNDSRAKESKILVGVFWAIAIILAIVLVWLAISELGSNGINIATAVIQIATFVLKFLLVGLVFIWVRWTLMRFRYDQLQALGWRVLLPLALVNIFVTSIVVVAVRS